MEYLPLRKRPPDIFLNDGVLFCAHAAEVTCGENIIQIRRSVRSQFVGVQCRAPQAAARGWQRDHEATSKSRSAGGATLLCRSCRAHTVWRGRGAAGAMMTASFVQISFDGHVLPRRIIVLPRSTCHLAFQPARSRLARLRTRLVLRFDADRQASGDSRERNSQYVQDRSCMFHYLSEASRILDDINRLSPPMVQRFLMAEKAWFRDMPEPEAYCFYNDFAWGYPRIESE